MSLEANDLVLFAQVVEAGSFSQAAERAGLPKSTLSRRISQLENTLGERLLVRTTRRLTLTDFGASLLEHARRLLAETEAAAAFASARQVCRSARVIQVSRRLIFPGYWRPSHCAVAQRFT